MASYYDDPHYSYLDYWTSRKYEHESEVLAINRLLSGQKFSSAVDIGGGFGRLIPVLSQYAKKVILIEPSLKLQAQAKKQLPKSISVLPGTAQKTRLPDHSQNLVQIIRVIHHLPEPRPTFIELGRILKPGGFLLLEFANSANFKAQIKSFVTGKPILPIAIDLRSAKNIRRKSIPFVNHHPHAIKKLLRQTGFEIIRTLSVSNFRSPFLKKILPFPVLLGLESFSQSFLSRFHFGPSIFILARKLDK